MSTPQELSFNPSDLTTAYREQRFDDISRTFLDVLMHFRSQSYRAIDAHNQYFIDMFVKHFLHLFTQEDYVPSDPDMVRFVELNPVIANLVAISSFRNTDPFIEILRNQTRNFAKMLALYSPRNTVRLDCKQLFDTEPNYATQWYFCFWENYKGCCAGKHTLENMQRHLGYQDPRMGAINGYVHHAYFGCTYADFEKDHLLKRHVNHVFQEWPPAKVPIVNKPDRRKIAILTAMWFPQQSVYRCTHSFVKALAKDFDLTLIHLGRPRDDLDRSLFREVRQFTMGNPIDLSVLTPNDWAMAYFPDIGMNIESIFLSNLRIAPIQICGYGHPVSTFGSRVDYWLGGRDIESIDDWERNYSERLVLVPGSGVAPNKPNYTPRGTYAPGEVMLINCAWSAQKINYPMLQRLRRIVERAKRKVRLRFFTGGALDGNGFIPMRRVIEEVVGAENVEVFDGMFYPEYMARLEQGDFTLDSYPFGGYATATDAIFLRKPIVTWQGTKFYNRSAASLLRHIGLEELIVHGGDAYEELAVKLIDDDEYRGRIVAKLAKLDLDKTIFAHDDAKFVAKAFHYLIDNHDRLRKDERRAPIIVDS